jgi:hypothetical protein
MKNSRKRNLKVGNYSDQYVPKGKIKFESPLALGLCATVPAAKDPIEAIQWQAQALIIESGLNEPPYYPSSYAQLRYVKDIVYKPMEVEGRLLPCIGGFTIELRYDRSPERKNFTCAHELGHTFFYEAVPSIKYRMLTSSQPHHDKEEEMLCNIAAAELLMPTSTFPKIVRNYCVSPESLQEIAQLFETSIAATTVRILSLNIWDAELILWQNKGEELAATWYAKPNTGLIHYPSGRIYNYSSSGIYNCFITGEATTSLEWIYVDGKYRSCRMRSVRLKNSKSVLSCISKYSDTSSDRVLSQKFATPELPFKYTCECDGTGWRRIEKEGRSYVKRCLALQHKSIS